MTAAADDGLLLEHLDVGTGSAVVLLHSTVADSRMWQAQLPELAGRHRVIAPDLRGFGATPLPPQRFSSAADVIRLLHHLDVDRFALVGSSGGGQVALQVATAIPDQVSRLVLLCTAADGVEPTASLKQFWSAEAALLDAGDLDGAARLNADHWLGPDAGADAHEALFSMQRHAFEVQSLSGDVPEDHWPTDLDRLRLPVTVVSGSHDLDHFALVAAHLAARLPSARTVVLEWAGHLPNLERPAEITAFLGAELQHPGLREGC